MTDSNTIIKASFNGDLRRFALPASSLASFPLFLDSLVQSLGSSETSGLRVRFEDPDGDLCTISSDLELQEALRCAQACTLRLILDEAGQQEQVAGNAQAKAETQQQRPGPGERRFKIARQLFQEQGINVAFYGPQRVRTLAAADGTDGQKPWVLLKKQAELEKNRGVLFLGPGFVRKLNGLQAIGDPVGLRLAIQQLVDRKLAQAKRRGWLENEASAGNWRQAKKEAHQIKKDAFSSIRQEAKTNVKLVKQLAKQQILQDPEQKPAIKEHLKLQKQEIKTLAKEQKQAIKQEVVHPVKQQRRVEKIEQQLESTHAQLVQLLQRKTKLSELLKNIEQTNPIKEQKVRQREERVSAKLNQLEKKKERLRSVKETILV